MNDDKVKVMVVEDEELLLRAINIKLKKLGVETVSCTSAEQALGYLEDMPDLPDAIWLDYYLKDMNGLDFMNKVKSDDRLSDIPVIVVSNSANEEKKSALLGLGAKKYMLKADNRLEDIAATIEEFVKNKNS